jgi:Gamma-glutamyl cyclotransferase, AIG2-like
LSRPGAGVRLFSYGTLQLPEVQIANYGRRLDGEPDTLIGYRLVPLEISDPNVVRISGKAMHTIACATGDPNDRIDGVTYRLTDSELEATDAYETDAYTREEVTLESGRAALVYAGPALAGGDLS